ncbi:MAG: hypothetical protein JWO38_5240 [Gemmataceae bacterium]|nr:hypothetical protein [Gemmataceae bacterium]
MRALVAVVAALAPALMAAGCGAKPADPPPAANPVEGPTRSAAKPPPAAGSEPPRTGGPARSGRQAEKDQGQIRGRRG